MDCTHPLHVEGASCEDYAVGCSPTCSCCLAPETIAHYARLAELEGGRREPTEAKEEKHGDAQQGHDDRQPDAGP